MITKLNQLIQLSTIKKHKSFKPDTFHLSRCSSPLHKYDWLSFNKILLNTLYYQYTYIILWIFDNFIGTFKLFHPQRKHSLPLFAPPVCCTVSPWQWPWGLESISRYFASSQDPNAVYRPRSYSDLLCPSSTPDLGLSVDCSRDFINSGWSHHVRISFKLINEIMEVAKKKC